jgi:hypothetical protein
MTAPVVDVIDLELPPPDPVVVHAHSRKTDLPRTIGQHWTAFYAESTNPIRDRPGAGFSLTKIIAGYFAYKVGFSIGALGGRVETNTLWLAMGSLAAAFGKSTFNFILSKMSLAGTTAQSDTLTLERKEVDVKIQQKLEETKRLITETRDTDTGEPLPGAPGQEVTP